MKRSSCRALVILLFDTLRSDFESLCAGEGVASLASFDKLKALTNPLGRVRCGSFPTVPMRTDLLTGDLAFLYRRWARPLDSDPIFTRAAAAAGIRTALVTDNYMMVVPRLGGRFDEFFEICSFIRGSGSDPWQDITDPPPAASPRPARSVDLEAQFLANVRAWQTAGGPPYAQLFAEAERCSAKLLGSGQFVLWIDCFSTHEPWVSPAQILGGTLPAGEPISPPYDRSSAYSDEQIAALKRQYALRIAAVDNAMYSFVLALDDAMKSGDIALIVLSDHGFLFGEYGLIGKPSAEPVLPPLHDLVAWVSPHFAGLIDRADQAVLLQPSDLPYLFSKLLGFSFTQGLRGPLMSQRPQIIGRHTDNAPTLNIATDEGFALFFRDSLKRPPWWYLWSSLDESTSWDQQGEAEIPYDRISPDLVRRFLKGKPWVEEFRESLGKLWG